MYLRAVGELCRGVKSFLKPVNYNFKRACCFKTTGSFEVIISYFHAHSHLTYCSIKNAPFFSRITFNIGVISFQSFSESSETRGRMFFKWDSCADIERTFIYIKFTIVKFLCLLNLRCTIKIKKRLFLSLGK